MTEPVCRVTVEGGSAGQGEVLQRHGPQQAAVDCWRQQGGGDGHAHLEYYLVSVQYYLVGGDCGDVVTLTREPALPPSTERATPAPLGTAIRTPTHSDLMQC